MRTLITCKTGCEKLLSRETALYDGKVQDTGRGWIIVQWFDVPLPDLCYGYHVLDDPLIVTASSVNSLTAKLLDLFTGHIKDKRINEPWPLQFSSSGDEALLTRIKTVETNWLEKLQRKMSRVAKLADKDRVVSETFTEGFFVHFIQLNHVAVAFNALGARQQRMQMDPQAPSRSFLKIEEAFCLLGEAPKDKDLVIDLGAAPGGWSYSALKRGASVIAVDNGPLTSPAAGHPKMTHLKVDAFKYQFDRSRPADWLLCDILDKPEGVLELLHTWLKHKWCRRFVVNLKVGRTDPILVLKKIRDPHEGVSVLCERLTVKQLYHDRDEITLMGEIKG